MLRFKFNKPKYFLIDWIIVRYNNIYIGVSTLSNACSEEYKNIVSIND